MSSGPPAWRKAAPRERQAVPASESRGGASESDGQSRQDAWRCGPCGQRVPRGNLPRFAAATPPRTRSVTAWLREHHLLSGNGRRATASPKGTIACTYPYGDTHGQRRYEAVGLTPKDFRPVLPDGRGDWIWHLQGVQRVRTRSSVCRRHAEKVRAQGEKIARRCGPSTSGRRATSRRGGAAMARQSERSS